MSISELSYAAWTLRGVGLVCFGIAVGACAWLVVQAPRFVPPAFGRVGRQRAWARKRSWFPVLEPVVAFVAAAVERSIPPRMRAGVQRDVVCAGVPLGFMAEEWCAVSLLSGALGACLGLGYAARGSMFTWGVVGGALGVALPLLRIRAMADERAKALERSLPSGMDLCILCMGAGADFPAALQFAIQELGENHAECREELSMVLDELRLGRTRVQALTALGERSSSLAVRDFVSAVCQSEIKGTPLVGALDAQARTLRQRRSVLAEEAAAKAGVKLMFPLMLLMLCILLIVIGPFLVRGGGW